MDLGIEKIQRRARGEDGFTMLDILVTLVVTSLLLVVTLTLMMNFVSSKRSDLFQANLPIVGKSVETFFVANPNASTVDLTKLPSIPESLEEMPVVMVGQRDDYCVISIVDGYADEQLRAGETSYVADSDSPYFVYRSVDGTVTKMADFSGLSCLSKGVTTVLS